jgi:hypothetical protein
MPTQKQEDSGKRPPEENELEVEFEPEGSDEAAERDDDEEVDDEDVVDIDLDDLTAMEGPDA